MHFFNLDDSKKLTDDEEIQLWGKDMCAPVNENGLGLKVVLAF